MKVLAEGLDIDGFFSGVRSADTPALMLDYDGTLAPFVIDRDRAFPYPGVRERVDAVLADSKTRLVIISGRPASDIPSLIGTHNTPEIWGSHGWERVMPDGTCVIAGLGEDESGAIDAARNWAEDLGHPERLEIKPAGAAFHLRGLGPSESDHLRKEALGYMGGLAARTRFEVHEFDGGVEMRLAGRDKGDAVETLIAELPPGAPIAYLGDDLTDEDAFMALHGKGLGVLVRPVLRETVAKLWLTPPEELLWFIDRWLDATGGGI